MEGTGIHIAPVYDGTTTAVTLTDNHGPVNIYMLPFIKPAHVRRFHPDEPIVSYTDALGTAVRRLPKGFDLEIAYLECGPTKFLSASKSGAKKLAWVHCDLILKNEDPAAFAKKTAPWYETFDHVVCVSEGVRESFRKLYCDRFPSSVLYNVNDEAEILRKADAFTTESADLPTLCAVGRLSQEKGFDLLIDECAGLQIPYRLQIIGEGPERQRREAQIARNNLGDRIRLLGWQENPYPYMKAADIKTALIKFRRLRRSRYEKCFYIETSAHSAQTDNAS